MATSCVSCGQPIEREYRLVGVEKGSWESRYAHRGSCEADARERFAPPPARARRPRKRAVPEEPEVEELTLDAPEPFPDDALPWFGTERRR